MIKPSIPTQTLKRLPQYLSYLKEMTPPENGRVSATLIATGLEISDVVVRKDLALISGSGKPKIGYDYLGLMDELSSYLGFKDADDAVLVGAGKLGRALMDYRGFEAYGLNIVAGFDRDRESCRPTQSGKPVYPMEDMAALIGRLKIRMAVITTPADCAQEVADQLIACGVLAIWSFAPARLRVPDNILVQQEDMAASLALLSNHLRAQMKACPV